MKVENPLHVAHCGFRGGIHEDEVDTRATLRQTCRPVRARLRFKKTLLKSVMTSETAALLGEVRLRSANRSQTENIDLRSLFQHKVEQHQRQRHEDNIKHDQKLHPKAQAFTGRIREDRSRRFHCPNDHRQGDRQKQGCGSITSLMRVFMEIAARIVPMDAKPSVPSSVIPHIRPTRGNRLKSKKTAKQLSMTDSATSMNTKLASIFPR